MKRFSRWRDDADLHNQLNRLVSDIQTRLDQIPAPTTPVVPTGTGSGTGSGGVGASASGGGSVMAGNGISVASMGGGSSEVSIKAPSVFLEDASGGPVVVNLPAAGYVGQTATIQKIDASGNSVEGAPNGSDTINGANSNTSPIVLQWDVIQLLCVAVGAWAIV